MICGSGHLLHCFALWFSSVVGIADILSAKGKSVYTFRRPKSFLRPLTCTSFLLNFESLNV